MDVGIAIILYTAFSCDSNRAFPLMALLIVPHIQINREILQWIFYSVNRLNFQPRNVKDCICSVDCSSITILDLNGLFHRTQICLEELKGTVLCVLTACSDVVGY